MGDAFFGIGQGRRFFGSCSASSTTSPNSLQFAEHADIIDDAVTRHGIDAEFFAFAEDRFEEAPVASARLLHFRLAHVLAVDMTDAALVAARQRSGSAPPRSHVRCRATVGGRARVGHESLDIGFGLDDRAHMVW